MKLNKALLYLLLAVLLLLAVSGAIPVADSTYSGDVDMLFTKHVHECQDRQIFWSYHVVTEPVQTVVNLLMPNCLDNYVLYTTLIGGCIFFLKLLLASTFRSPAEALTFLLATLIFSNLFTETHLFRQFASSYLLLYWLCRRPARRGFMIPLLSFGFHNATTIILLSVLYWQKILLIGRRQKLVIALVPAVLVGYVTYQLPELIGYFYLRYGFAFTESYSGTGAAAGLVAPLLKYFVLAIAAGLLSRRVFEKRELLTIGIVGVAILATGLVSGVSEELVFRLLIPLKFVFLPYYASVLLMDCWDRYIIQGKALFNGSSSLSDRSSDTQLS